MPRYPGTKPGFGTSGSSFAVGCLRQLRPPALLFSYFGFFFLLFEVFLMRAAGLAERNGQNQVLEAFCVRLEGSLHWYQRIGPAMAEGTSSSHCQLHKTVVEVKQQQDKHQKAIEIITRQLIQLSEAAKEIIQLPKVAKETSQCVDSSLKDLMIPNGEEASLFFGEKSKLQPMFSSPRNGHGKEYTPKGDDHDDLSIAFGSNTAPPRKRTSSGQGNVNEVERGDPPKKKQKLESPPTPPNPETRKPKRKNMEEEMKCR